MKTIGELLKRDLSRKIEEIIQVDQADEQSVYAEITEYVATDSIREQYHHLLKAVAEAAKVRSSRTWATRWKTVRSSAASSRISSSNNWAMPGRATCSISSTPGLQPKSFSLK